jgi:2-oxoglutarate ferredoxin oxidoreductase subunit gamma
MIDFSINLAASRPGQLSAGKFARSGSIEGTKSRGILPTTEMRGGTANCSVVISDRRSDLVINERMFSFALNSSLEKFEKQVKRRIIINDSSLIKIVPTRQDIRFIPIASSDIASELGSMAFATIVLLGCLSEATGCFKRESFEAALRDVLPERHHDKIPGNLAAFDRGASFAK